MIKGLIGLTGWVSGVVAHPRRFGWYLLSRVIGGGGWVWGKGRLFHKILMGAFLGWASNGAWVWHVG